MENLRMSQKLETLMRKARIAREIVMCNRYSNGSYSGYAGSTAKETLASLESSLLALMKEAIRDEAVADTKDQIIAQFTVQIR